MLADPAAIAEVVVDGALSHRGMVSFRAALNEKDAEAVRQYLLKRANDDKAAGR